MNKFFDQGYDEYKDAPDLMLIEVWRRAFTAIGADMGVQDFVNGYIAARKHREDSR